MGEGEKKKGENGENCKSCNNEKARNENILTKHQVTIMNGVGCVVAIVGIIWYNSIEYQIKEEKKHKAVLMEKEEKLGKETPLENIITTEKTDD